MDPRGELHQDAMSPAVWMIQSLCLFVLMVELDTVDREKYRENEKLSKINGKLTEENTRLRAENKDYSLLRRVFGHKQIDSLLEQARNLKGQKRDHTRSR